MSETKEEKALRIRMFQTGVEMRRSGDVSISSPLKWHPSAWLGYQAGHWIGEPDAKYMGTPL
jgi:hypothetical protein